MMLKRSVSFFLEKRKKDGITVTENVPIRMRVKFDGNRIEFTTGYRIDADKWDSTKQKVKSGCSNRLKQTASQINTALSRYDADIQTIFQHFEMTNLVPTPEKIKEAFNARTDITTGEKAPIQNQLSFWEIYDLFTKESGKMNDWTEATYEKFAAAKNHLRDFDKNMTFESLSENRLNDYVLFLRNKKNLRNSTIGKQMGFFKWFLRWAHHKGYHKNTAFEVFRPKLKQARKTVVFLTEEELTQLKAFQIPDHKQHLDRVRDVFLFWTGHSDYKSMKPYIDVADKIRANEMERFNGFGKLPK